jgi:hypothetical protein
MTDNLSALLAANGLALDNPAKLIAGAFIDPVSTASGTVQSTVYDLNNVTVPANFLSRGGRGLKITAFGTTAANANAKDLAILVGGVTVASVTGSTANAKDFVFEVTILRTGKDTQVAYSKLIVDGALVAASCGITTEAIDEDAAAIVKLTAANTAAAAASATGKGLVVELLG